MNEHSTDYALPLPVLAEMARQGLHDLNPYWSPDTDSMIDPLSDRETREIVRSFVGKVWRASWDAEQQRKRTLRIIDGSVSDA